MTSMVEKVARAIAEAEGFQLPNDMSLPYAEGSRIGMSMAKARAAIEAMREPDEGMLDAYWHQAGESKEMRPRTHHSAKRYYQVMIDAALKETP